MLQADWTLRPTRTLVLAGVICMASAWLCLTPRLQAQGYCSLTVNVTDPKGSTVDANVSVKESDGRTEEKRTTLGSVKFCDLGMKPVDISVGHPACNQVVVKSVRLRWGDTARVKIIYDREPCLIDDPPLAVCQVLLRFTDGNGKWLKGVALTTQSPESKVFTADEYGRVHLVIPAFKELRGVGAVAGYEAAGISIPCTSENQRVERRLALKRAAP